jgi:cephalosporin hydroxylase
MNPIEKFQAEVNANIEVLGADAELWRKSLDWMLAMAVGNYSYNFSWMGRPIIQYPQDIVAVQELIWRVQPDLVIETGIAHGGSLILSASLLALLDYSEAVRGGTSLNPRESRRRVLGVDIDIRAHNLAAIQAHPMAHLIEMYEGSSVDPAVVSRVALRARDFQRVLVMLDSNHTHEHVLAELRGYGPLVTPGSYCVVFDTAVEDMPPEYIHNRPWGPGNSPKSAVYAFLEQLGGASPMPAADGASLRFALDRSIQHKLQITVAGDGFLRRE